MWTDVRQDFHRGYSQTSYAGHGRKVFAVVTAPGFQAVWLYRVSRWLLKYHVPLVGLMLQRFAEVWTGISIPAEARIGPGLLILHSGGIVVHDKAVLGRDCTLHHEVTIGNRRSGGGAPRLGDRVMVGVGAKVLGAITVGDDAEIGANAVVLEDVPAGGVAVGLPARVVRVKQGLPSEPAQSKQAGPHVGGNAATRMASAALALSGALVACGAAHGMAAQPGAEPRAASPVAGFEVRVVSSAEKVLPELGLPASATSNPVRLFAAAGEAESAQLVLLSDHALTQVVVQPGVLRHERGEGDIPAGAIEWYRVGYVRTRQPGYQVSHVGLWPDPLFLKEPSDVAPNVPQPIWITVHVPEDARPGRYTGELTVRPSGAPPQTAAVELTVWDFALPQRPSLSTAFDVYPNRLAQAYQTHFPQWWKRWQADPDALADRFYESLVRYRLSPMLNADFDQERHERRVALLAGQGMSAFSLGPHSGSFDNNWPEDPAALEALALQYGAWAERLQARGLLGRQYIYAYDEPPVGAERVAAVTAMLHRADPRLRTLVTLSEPLDPVRHAGWLSDIDIVCLRNVTFDPAAAQALRHAGHEVWLYVSGPKPPYPTLVLDYPSMAYRVLPWMCWKYGLSGLLYWSVNFWSDDPYKNPMNTKWEQNGNGLLYYPGPAGPVPSLRLEVLRDGLEDYEYLHRLDALVHRAEAEGPSRPELAPLIARAHPLLDVDWVQSMKDYASDPAQLSAARQAIGRLIEELQTALGPERRLPAANLRSLDPSA